MKNLTSLFAVILITVSISTYSQVSKQEAIDIVIDTIYVDLLDSVSIFMEADSLSEQYFLINPYDSILSPYSHYWLFFIDKQPRNLSWGHECAYLFVNRMDGNYEEFINQKPPYLYYKQLEHVSLSFVPTGFSHDFSGGPMNPIYPETNEHLFAVLFAVSEMAGYDYPYIWNNLSHTYIALKNNGFPDENIYILFKDGVPLGNGTDFPSLNLDNDNDDEIMEDIICNSDNLDNIFTNILKDDMDEDDLLFIYSWTHGYDTEGVPQETYLGLHGNEEYLYDFDLADMIEEVTCSELIYVNESCNGGGILDNFSGNHQTVITTVEWGMTIANNSVGIDQLGFTPYTYSIITALRGEHPFDRDEPWSSQYTIGNHPSLEAFDLFNHLTNGDFNPDTENNGNSDGVIQINESVIYGQELFPTFNNFGQHIYNSGFDEADDLLSLTGISGNIETTQTIDGSFLIGGNLNIESGVTLTVDNESKLFLVNGSISTESGSTLDLQSGTEEGQIKAVLVHNFSEGGSMSVLGDLTAGPEVKFSSVIGTSLNMSILSDVTFSDCEFVNVTFSSGGHHLFGGFNLTINQSSSFTNSLIQGAGHYDIDNCTFSNSTINLYPEEPLGWECSAFITSSTFYLPHPGKNNIISLGSVQEFNIEGNTFSNYADQYNGGSSLFLEYCGNSGTSSWHQIRDNIFTTIEGQTHSNTNGISLYSSNAYIRNNNIQYQQNGISLYGNCQTNVIGSSWATSENGTQQIKNNSNLQVYASEYAFPYNFEYNVVYEDTYSQTYILHDLIPGHYPVEDVECNYWGNNDPGIHLLPLNHYDYTPIWDLLPGCNESQTAAAALYQTGIDQVADSNYNAAQSTFEEVVTDYPDTEPANNAMKELLIIEPLVDSTDYVERQDWYLTESAILGNNRLKKIGENLANKCDEKLENYPDAIDWYENMIDDPPTLQDSVFAIIDLENVYLAMGIDTSLRSSYVGRMPQYKPASIKTHQKHRDELLALLGNVNKNNIDDSFPETEEDNKPGELLKNTPNPFTGTTQISYNLKIESDVQLIVDTYTGQLVKTINLGTKTKGIHFIDFDASELKSGIYFYSLNINGQTIDSKKMVKLK